MRRVLLSGLFVALTAAACGGGSGDKQDASAATTAASSTTAFAARTTTTTVPSGPIPTAASCPTAAELQAIVHEAPGTGAPPPSVSSTGISCDYIWDPDPRGLVTVSLYRYPSQSSLETSFASDRKRAEDIAAGRDHSGEPGTVTDLSGVGDAAFIQMERPTTGEQRPPDYTVRARAGTLLVKVHLQDNGGARFGADSDNATFTTEISQLAIRKVGS
jgi:hypothetical protein